MRSEILTEDEKIPDVLADPKKLGDLGNLLVYASQRGGREPSLQSWACALLKVMHVLVHLDSDLFTKFSSPIQEQILRPIQAHIYNDPVRGVTLGPASDPESIVLKKFDVKAFKTSSSSITKLLAKPDVVAFSLLDKVGVRFITKHLFDAFRVMRYLSEKNIVCIPHNVPDQSNNTLYPTNLFLQEMENLTGDQKITPEEIDQRLVARLERHREDAKYLLKLNSFSSLEYRFIKFITRRMIRVKNDGGQGPAFTFFYPFEVQIVDYQTYLENLSGKASHDKYKARQKKAARQRTLAWAESGQREE